MLWRTALGYGGAGSFADYDFYAESVVAGQLNSTEDFTNLHPDNVVAVSNSEPIAGLVFAF